jgi:nicotinamide-nucleotide amidase
MQNEKPHATPESLKKLRPARCRQHLHHSTPASKHAHCIHRFTGKVDPRTGSFPRHPFFSIRIKECSVPNEQIPSTIFELAASVGQTLHTHGLVLATAESCTGGGVSQAVTEVAGSTSWFDCGFVVYSNASKTELLDVPDALIAQFGSVSEEVAAVMAQGALANSNANVALSTTGIAGPTGAVPGKPVGTVCFGWATKDGVHTERLVFTGDRQSVREQSVRHALQGLLRFVA